MRDISAVGLLKKALKGRRYARKNSQNYPNIKLNHDISQIKAEKYHYGSSCLLVTETALAVEVIHTLIILVTICRSLLKSYFLSIN